MNRVGPLLGVVLACGCSGSARQIEIGPPPAPRTMATLAGPLCRDGVCTCRDATRDAGTPEGARKRFEVRLRSAQALWLTMPGETVLYKSPERVEECFYVDLAPGEHPITLRASDPDGVSAEVIVREYGTRTNSWYDTFRFECGHPGACSFEELDGLRAHYAQFARNLHDPCGSTKVKGISWDHGKAPDGTHPSELVVRASLDIYEFAPWKPHGDATCGEGGGRPPAEEAPAEESPAAAPAAEPAP